jgi:hypothetical protein
MRWHNAKYYFSNVSLYLNGDHYPELKMYLGSIYDRFNIGLRTTPSSVDEVGNAQHLCALFTSEVQCGACVDDVTAMEWTEGGDAAAGNSIAGLGPPPAKLAAAITAKTGGCIGLTAHAAAPPSGAPCSNARSEQTIPVHEWFFYIIVLFFLKVFCV